MKIRPFYLMFGRIVAIMALLLLIPILCLLAVLVKVTSTGPVFYISERLGRGGKVFRLYKYRSMYKEARMITAKDGKVLTLENDQRVTKVGRFLRLGFDELPQLLNIAKGEMALVGPRPDVPWELERYSEREKLRLSVHPGITGLAAVVGGRNMTNAENYELDVRYVERANAWVDLQILACTLPYSFGAKNVGKRVFNTFLKNLPK